MARMDEWLDELPVQWNLPHQLEKKYRLMMGLEWNGYRDRLGPILG